MLKNSFFISPKLKAINVTTTVDKHIIDRQLVKNNYIYSIINTSACLLLSANSAIGELSVGELPID